MSALTITRQDLARYEREGWVITDRNLSESGGRTYEVLTLRGESSIVEDAGRSFGYIIGAPVVFTLSLVGSALAMTVGAMAACAGGRVVEERGTTRYTRFDPEQAEFSRTLAEGCCCVAPCKLVPAMNVGFFELAKPFQGRTIEFTVKIPE